MINIDLSNQDIYEDYNNLFQWDYGQSLAISGLNVTSDVEVHFARQNTDAEIRLGTYSNGIVTVSIPDMILQKSGKFSAYIYQTNATSGETIKVIHMNVREREQPTDYTTPEYENIVYELNSKLEQIIATGIANYQPDPAVVDVLVTQKVNAMLSTLGDMASKDQVAKLDLTQALAAELDGKINSSKITTTLAPTQTGFVHDAKTVGDAITVINDNLALQGPTTLSIIDATVFASNYPGVNYLKYGKVAIFNYAFSVVAPAGAYKSFCQLPFTLKTTLVSYIGVGAKFVLTKVNASGLVEIYTDSNSPAGTVFYGQFVLPLAI